MTQENRKTLKILNILSDGLLLFLALALAYGIRFGLFTGMAGHRTLGPYLAAGCWLVPVMLLLYGLFGIYAPVGQRTFIKQLERLIPAAALGSVLLLAAFSFLRDVDFSRWTVALFFVLAVVLPGAKHYAVKQVVLERRRKGLGIKRVLLIGSGDAAEDYARIISRDPSLGYALIGCVTDGRVPQYTTALGTLWDLDRVLEETGPDEAVAALSAEEASAISDVIDAAEKAGVKLALLPYYARHLPSRPYIESVGGLPLMNLRRIPLDNLLNAFCKRAMDVVGAALGLVVFSPLMLFAAVGTRLSSPGPIIFRQTRVGKDKKNFTMLKFRSMRVTDRADTAWTTDNDPRKTRFGAFIRKFSIDELPQLVNVLKGEMSLVGPRPELPHFVEQFKESVPLYMVKHQVRPGITGWAQVNGLRGDTSIPERIRHDIWYIENWSLLLDAKILFLTVTRAFVNPEKLVKKTG